MRIENMVIAQFLWLFLSVVCSGILHMVIVKKELFLSLAKPIDCGFQIRGKDLFGPNKTWRGFLVMPLLTMLVGSCQGTIEWIFKLRYLNFFSNLNDRAELLSSIVQYAEIGFILGLSYVIGELPNSFLKRQFGIKSGKKGVGYIGKIFLFADHIDSPLMCMIALKAIYGFAWHDFTSGLFIFFLLHYSISYSLFLHGIKKEP